MGTRTSDGSAGDADYGSIGREYAQYRRPDPRLFEVISEALGDASTVLNVGAGAGSYEPTDRRVTAVEPSESMRAQRPGHLSRALDGTAESLPFSDRSFDAAMTTFSVHQWQDTAAGLREMRRVTRGPVVILTCDPQRVEDFWLTEYAPEVTATEARRYPGLDELEAGLGGRARSVLVPIPLDCTDGFNEAYYGRPEGLLDPGSSALLLGMELRARGRHGALRARAGRRPRQRRLGRAARHAADPAAVRGLTRPRRIAALR